MGSKSAIEWTDATWTPIRAKVKADAVDIATAKGYTSLVKILTATKADGSLRVPPGKIGPHCERVSAECDHCYSETNNGRCLPANGTGLPFDRRARDLIDPIVDENILKQPLHWKTPKKIFVCSQTDLFGEWVTDDMIDRVFAVMALCHWHTFQVLTKRPERMRAWFDRYRDEMWANDTRQFDLAGCLVNAAAQRLLATGPFDDETEQYPIPEKWLDNSPWLDLSGPMMRWPLFNVWIGVSVGNRAALPRIDSLREAPAAVRFLSLEPLLENLGEINLEGIHWVIVGGESGHGARPMNPVWVRDIRDQCTAAGVAFHFKQNGEFVSVSEVAGEGAHFQFSDGATVRRVGKKAAGRTLDGRTWDELPEVSV